MHDTNLKYTLLIVLLLSHYHLYGLTPSVFYDMDVIDSFQNQTQSVEPGSQQSRRNAYNTQYTEEDAFIDFDTPEVDDSPAPQFQDIVPAQPKKENKKPTLSELSQFYDMDRDSNTESSRRDPSFSTMSERLKQFSAPARNKDESPFIDFDTPDAVTE